MSMLLEEERTDVRPTDEVQRGATHTSVSRFGKPSENVRSEHPSKVRRILDWDSLLDSHDTMQRRLDILITVNATQQMAREVED